METNMQHLHTADFILSFTARHDTLWSRVTESQLFFSLLSLVKTSLFYLSLFVSALSRRFLFHLLFFLTPSTFCLSPSLFQLPLFHQTNMTHPLRIVCIL